MKIDLKPWQLVAGVFFATLAGTGYTAEAPLDLTTPASRFYTQDTKSFMLAANDTDTVKAQANTQTRTTTVTPAAEFEPPLISGSKAHQYFGISTVALAALTALTHPDECEGTSCPPRDVNGTHATLAKATVAMAAATIATGLYAHWHDISLEEGWADPDNLHVLLAGTGAMLLAYAVSTSANSPVPVSHAGLAEAGAIGMVVAIKLTW